MSDFGKYFSLDELTVTHEYSTTHL